MYHTQFYLTASQAAELDKRKKREFKPVAPEANLIVRIDRASTVFAVAQIVMSYKICDYCDFTGASLSAASMMAKVIAKVTYRFPKIRNKFCFVGTKAGYIKIMQSICANNRAVLDRFQIGNICSYDTIVSLATDALLMMDNTEYNGEKTNVLATAFSMCGIFDALVVDEADFSTLGYVKLTTSLRLAELSGEEAKGCGKPDSVIYHECGHLLDYLCGLSDDRSFIKYFESFTSTEIAKGLSEYGASNIGEFFAEAFAEYMCSPAPREIAAEAYNFILKKYRKL